MKKRLHVSPRGDGWEVRREGATVARSKHASFEAARSAGVTVARFERGSVTIHRPNGQFAETISFRERRSARRAAS